MSDTPECTESDWVWRYGLRERKIGAPGQTEYDPVPLTKEDFLHPRVGDRFTNSPWHGDTALYLHDALASLDGFEEGADVVGKVGLDFGIDGLRPMCPDVTLLSGLKSAIPGSMCPLALKALGATPELVIEVTYHLIRDVDLVDKVSLYHRAGVKHYLIVDLNIIDEESVVGLILYRWDESGFVRVNSSEREAILPGPLEARLVVEGERVRMYTPDGEPVPTIRELHQRRRQLRQQLALAEATRAEQQRQILEMQQKTENRRMEDRALQTRLQAALAELARVKGQP